MKRLLGTLTILALLGMPAMAQLNTLYEQEGTGSDGYAAIDASGQGPATNPNSTNWQYQFGGTSTWSAVYSWDSNAWVEEATSGVADDSLDIECDIEMFCSTSITDPKIYFHIGNIYNLVYADRTATVAGTMVSNNGQYIGISFDGSSKDSGDFDLNTGIITDAMVGTVDCGGRDISSEAFDIKILMDDGVQGYRTPDAYGDGAHSTIHDTLWWLVNGGTPGSYSVTWLIELQPATHQPDGNYHLDPVVVAAPTL
jgi:hypothetical protein